MPQCFWEDLVPVFMQMVPQVASCQSQTIKEYSSRSTKTALGSVLAVSEIFLGSHYADWLVGLSVVWAESIAGVV